MSSYLKLAEAPEWVLQYPTCSACDVDLFTDGDGWLCENCGTSWSMNASDGDRGLLYEEWSGEKLDGAPVSEAQAWRIADEKKRAEHAALLAKIRADSAARVSS